MEIYGSKSQRRTTLSLSFISLAIAIVVIVVPLILGAWKWLIVLSPLAVGLTFAFFYFQTTDDKGKKNDWMLEAAFISWIFFVVLILMIVFWPIMA